MRPLSLLDHCVVRSGKALLDRFDHLQYIKKGNYIHVDT